MRAFPPKAWLPTLMLLGGCATTSPATTTAPDTATPPATTAPPPAARATSRAASSPATTETLGNGQTEVRAKLQAVLDHAAEVEKSPGMVMAVQMGNSEPMYFTTGFQDEKKTRPMTMDQKFRVGSITKNFVGTAILQQVDEGKLSLDDTLEKWLPGIIPNIDGNGITIRQMLNHSSGIESFTNDEGWAITVYSNPTHRWDVPAELLGLTQRQRAYDIKCNQVAPPGSGFFYSNSNYALLGMIAAKVDGFGQTEWWKVIQRRFFTRLHMDASSIPANDDSSLGSTNRGYVNYFNFYLNPDHKTSQCTPLSPPCADSDIDITQQNMTNAWSAGAIISTAKDLLTWLNAELKGDLLSAKIRKEQQTFSATCNTPAPAGKALAGKARRVIESIPTGLSMITDLRSREPQSKSKSQSQAECTPVKPHCDNSVEAGLALFKQDKYGFIGHRGEIFGFDNTIQYLPEKDLTVVVLSNRTALSGNIVGPVPEDVAAVLYPDLKPQPGYPASSTAAPAH